MYQIPAHTVTKDDMLLHTALLLIEKLQDIDKRRQWQATNTEQ